MGSRTEIAYCLWGQFPSDQFRLDVSGLGPKGDASLWGSPQISHPWRK
jgi:hypothetical protein